MGNTGWFEFLRGSEPGHAAQLYGDLSDLAGSVASFLVSGFELGQGAIIVSTAEHHPAFMSALDAAGWDEARIEHEGLLVTADAEESLAAILDGGESPSPSAFAREVGAMLDRFPGTHVRVFGEMVDVLCKSGRQDAAMALEELWNGLAQRRDFSLLCGYNLDVFDRRSQADTLPHVCRAHSHVLPVLDPARLQRAVDQALEEVLGAAEAGKVYVVVSQELRGDRVPMAQVLLMWISENMPALAERVLASARLRYAAEPVVSL